VTVPHRENNDSFRAIAVKAVLKETLRLFPPFPMASRETRHGSGVVMPPQDPTFGDAETKAPMYIPPGAAISTISFLMHRNSALWGNDAFEFDPERWVEPERIKEHVRNPTRYLPFSAGPRNVRPFPIFHPLTPLRSFVVLGARLCSERSLLFPRSNAPTVWEVHAC